MSDIYADIESQLSITDASLVPQQVHEYLIPSRVADAAVSEQQLELMQNIGRLFRHLAEDLVFLQLSQRKIILSYIYAGEEAPRHLIPGASTNISASIHEVESASHCPSSDNSNDNFPAPRHGGYSDSGEYLFISFAMQILAFESNHVCTTMFKTTG